ncbi:hypothetical protein ACHAXT_007347 [Thalassiosira profunda]
MATEARKSHKRMRAEDPPAAIPDLPDAVMMEVEREDPRAAARDIDILDLPEAVIVAAADYLPKTSRALLALALTQMHHPGGTALVAAGSWEEMDFVDVDKALAKKLTDDDVAGLLSCIDAATQLRSLKLTGCVNITGRGLQPLAHSTALQRLDLSLKRQCERPSRSKYARKASAVLKGNLSKAAVIPVLESLVDAFGCSLKYLQLPPEWLPRGDIDDPETTCGEIGQFLQKYQNAVSQRIVCTSCEDICHEVESPEYPSEKVAGTQVYTCYSCLSNYCYECTGDGDAPLLSYCFGCGKDYCNDCHPFETFSFCEECQVLFCKECKEQRRCSGCDLLFCGSSGCVGDWIQCDATGCRKTECSDCSTHIKCRWCQKEYNRCSACDIGDHDGWGECGVCERSQCFDCRLEIVRHDWTSACQGCMRIVGPKLTRNHDMLQASRKPWWK